MNKFKISKPLSTLFCITYSRKRRVQAHLGKGLVRHLLFFTRLFVKDLLIRIRSNQLFVKCKSRFLRQYSNKAFANEIGTSSLSRFVA
jgi:hypothetical protein